MKVKYNNFLTTTNLCDMDDVTPLTCRHLSLCVSAGALCAVLLCLSVICCVSLCSLLSAVTAAF